MKNILIGLCFGLILISPQTAFAESYVPAESSHTLFLKVPGNPAREYPLSPVSESNGKYRLAPAEPLPVSVRLTVRTAGNDTHVAVTVTATEDIRFHYGQRVPTGFDHDRCQFLMPGFWYRRNLRSPREAPSFHTSDSWTVREDRLSTPLTGIYDEQQGRYLSVLRTDPLDCDALTTHTEGEVIVSGTTSLGFTGFANRNGKAFLHFGFPYQETPKSYIRKLTLAPPVRAFQHLSKGESVELNWTVTRGETDGYSGFVQQIWESSYDRLAPQPVETPYTEARMKETLAEYFAASYVGNRELKYTSGVHLRTSDCLPLGQAEVGFIGRVLLNAFNALEYGEQNNRPELASQARSILESYRNHGFTPGGLIRESVDFSRGTETDVFSIRRQSEGIYALLYYLNYEKERKRNDRVLEQKVRALLDRFLTLQNADGSFPRKFRDDGSLVDASGGSTPSATVPLVMAYRYFRDKRYLEAAQRSAGYLEREIIAQSDYFSSTLDANCEDKEASLYAATAMYYLALVTEKAEKTHYTALARKAAYFALSWYYLWDVPFARGQMLGDIGMKTRGWGNVSVENNHIDVFVFEFAEVLHWLAGEYGDGRFSDFSKVIHTSMRQLLPYEGHLCGVARTGYYPEVVQHTRWDYGKNGKGYYNDIFAPGWVVASLWELLSPGRAEAFLKK